MNRSGQRALLGATLVTVAGMTLPSVSQAQAAPGTRLSISVGVVRGQGDLPAAPILENTLSIVRYESLPVMPTLGLGVERSIGTLPLSARATVAHGWGGERLGTWSCGSFEGQPLPCPAILLEVPTSMSLTRAGVDLVYDVPVGRVYFTPSVGAAWLRHRYTWNPDVEYPEFSIVEGGFSANAVALQLGVGVRVPVSGVTVALDFSALESSSAPTRPGRATSATIGLVVPLR